MALKDVLKDIEGYQDIRHDIEILKKYGTDYTSQKGVVERIIEGLHPKRIRIRVSEIWQETKSTKTLRFVAKDGFLPPFQAGQYINIFVDTGGIRTSRAYSISSSPTQLGYYDITIRSVEDGFVSSYFLDEVRVGDETRKHIAIRIFLPQSSIPRGRPRVPCRGQRHHPLHEHDQGCGRRSGAFTKDPPHLREPVP